MSSFKIEVLYPGKEVLSDACLRMMAPAGFDCDHKEFPLPELGKCTSMLCRLYVAVCSLLPWGRRGAWRRCGGSGHAQAFAHPLALFPCCWGCYGLHDFGYAYCFFFFSSVLWLPPSPLCFFFFSFLILFFDKLCHLNSHWKNPYKNHAIIVDHGKPLFHN